MLREKGVAFVKFPTASEAATALENLHLKNIRNGTDAVMLKVMIADDPRAPPGSAEPPRSESRASPLMPDPENHPPRSRLFLTVPRDTDPASFEAALYAMGGCESVKLDLICSKGVVYAKFRTASAALRALEDIEAHGSQIIGKPVKAVVAEPKVATRSTSGFLHDDPPRARSVTPSQPWAFDARHDGAHSAQSWQGGGGGYGAPPGRAPDGLDCNPLFWAWLHSQGVHTLDSVASMQHVYAEWQAQGCPGPFLGGPPPPARAPAAAGHVWHTRSRATSPSMQMRHGLSSDELIGGMQQMCAGVPPRPYNTRAAAAAARAYSASHAFGPSRPTSCEMMPDVVAPRDNPDGVLGNTSRDTPWGFGLASRTSGSALTACNATQTVDLPQDENSWSHCRPHGSAPPLGHDQRLDFVHARALSGPFGGPSWPPYIADGGWGGPTQGIWAAAPGAVPPSTAPSSTTSPRRGGITLRDRTKQTRTDPPVTRSRRAAELAPPPPEPGPPGESLTSRNSSSTAMAVESHADVAGAADAPVAARTDSWPQARNEVIFFHLSDRMPDYALRGHFEKYGPVESVALHASDARWGAVTFATAEAAGVACTRVANDRLFGCTIHCLPR